MLFPEHGLSDDILYTKANALVRLKKYDEAVTLYDKIVMDYPEEIRADNALFALAALHENQLEDLDRAKNTLRETVSGV